MGRHLAPFLSHPSWAEEPLFVFLLGFFLAFWSESLYMNTVIHIAKWLEFFCPHRNCHDVDTEARWEKADHLQWRCLAVIWIFCSRYLELSVTDCHFFSSAPFPSLFVHVWLKVGALMEDRIPRIYTRTVWWSSDQMLYDGRNERKIKLQWNTLRDLPELDQ